VPTSLRLVVELLNTLSAFLSDNATPPQLTPLTDGGMQAEWHRGGKDLEIVVTAEGEPSYYFFDYSTGTEEEAIIATHTVRVAELIDSLD
jgi:hypothetical protein